MIDARPKGTSEAVKNLHARFMFHLTERCSLLLLAHNRASNVHFESRQARLIA
ncbi:MAG: hypothetical protein K2Y19_19845 [Afipia birgiae]|nr:hypothetical protein [Afipia birgiae]